LITEINTRIGETLKFFNFSFGSGIGYELIKDDSEFKKVQQIKKIPKNILQGYNFENKETDETIDKNYDIYTSLYKSVVSFGELRGSLSQLSRKKIQPHYIKLFSSYFDDLDRYSSALSIKNYYILYSILSQILGITFFLMLFRSILANREKK
jgi:hypothetical protein